MHGHVLRQGVDCRDKAAAPLLLLLQVRVGICWQLELPEEGHLMRVAGDQRWLGQACAGCGCVPPQQ